MFNAGLLSIFKILSSPFHWRFVLNLKNPQKAQERLLKVIIAESARTDYGKSLGLRADDTYEEFTRKIHLSTYEDLRPFLEKQTTTHDLIIAPSKIACFEKTSGSSGVSKYIPYTFSLKKSFAKMFLIWAHDLLAHGPRLKTGKLFISVSPAFREETTTASGVSVGLENDHEYVDGITRFFLKKFLVLPEHLKQIQDPFQYRYVLALSLLAASDLEVVSVWNPNYFETILDFISKHRKELLQTLQAGHYAHEKYIWNFSTTSATEAELLKEESQDLSWNKIWPELKLLSCWTDASAEYFSQRLLHRLQQGFSSLILQGKGLLATEAAMTIPLVQASGAVPFMTDVFFEFIDSDNKVHRLEQIKVGQEYDIAVTQRSGLLRYKIGDRVLVTGTYLKTPLLKFLGRSSLISDLVGEKLNIQFVESALKEVGELKNEEFNFLFSDAKANPPCYKLVLSADQDADIAKKVEERLMKTTHYRLARLLGQLGPLQALEHANPQAAYYSTLEQLGLKWGDIKFQRLVTRTDFAQIYYKNEVNS